MNRDELVNLICLLILAGVFIITFYGWITDCGTSVIYHNCGLPKFYRGH